ncbi:hypothetical protein BH09BAC5_BH09BAC5_21700 [soil metagenome]
MIRYLFYTFLFFSSYLSAQRDSVIGGIKCHLISENSDTGSAWIQKVIVKKGKEKFNGTYFEFYPGGKLKAKGYYKNGKRYQKWIRYYADGKKSEEGYFDKGEKSDLWITYYENGQISWKGSFFKDIRSGFWRYYYEDGKLKGMTRYRIKTEKINRKPKEGDKKKKGMSVKTNVEFIYTVSPADSLVEYYPDGKLKTRIIYGKEGGLNGAFDSYYENGKSNVHGEYTAGKKSGQWNYYCENEKIFRYEKYSVGNDNPEVIQGTDTCTSVEECLPWMKWEVEIITK